MPPKKQDLQDFFNKNKKAKKPAAKQEATAEQQQQKQEAANDTMDAKPKQKKEDFYESSEDEQADLDIGQSGIKIVNKQEIEAENRKKRMADEENSGQGWKLEPAKQELNMSAPKTAGPSISQPKGAAEKGEIQFGKSKGPPKFTNKKHMKKIDEDFPELDENMIGKKATDLIEPSKKDQADIGMFGAQAKGQSAQDKPAVEEKKEATKPVFTNSKKKKLDLGGADLDQIQSSKQNYDFSSMKFSSASSKVANKGPREEGAEEEQKEERRPKRDFNNESREQRQRAPQPKAPAFEDDGDFTVVTDKKRR